MMQVSQSPFLQALGFAIINSLWQFAFLWLVYLLISSVGRLSSHQKYAAALSLHVAGFAWFSGTILFYYQQCVEFSSSVSTSYEPITLAAYAGNSFKEKLLEIVVKGELLLPYLSLAYIILLGFLALKTVRCYYTTQLIRTEGLEKIDVEWRLFVQKLSSQFGIKRKVNLYLSSLTSSPVTIGYLKPIILLPIAALNNLSTDQIEAVLLHELAHIKRHDYIINLLLSIIELSLFFNPFMQLMSKHIKRERENSCDDWVLQFQYSAASYAKALLTIATTKTHTAPAMAIGAVDNNKALLIRVKRMIEKNNRSNYRQQLVAFVFMTSIICAAAWLSPTDALVSKKTSRDGKAVMIKPMAVKVDNPLFNPVFFLADIDKKKLENEVNKVRNEVTVTVASIPTLRSETVRSQTGLPQMTNERPAIILPVKRISEEEIVLDLLKADSLGPKERTIYTKALNKIDFKKIEDQIEKSQQLVLANNFWADQIDNAKLQQQLLENLNKLRKIQLNVAPQIKAAMNASEARKRLSEEKRRDTEERNNGKIEYLRFTNVSPSLPPAPMQALFVDASNNEGDEEMDVPAVVFTPAVATTTVDGEHWSYSYRVTSNVTYHPPVPAEAPLPPSPPVGSCDKATFTVTGKTGENLQKDGTPVERTITVRRIVVVRI